MHNLEAITIQGNNKWTFQIQTKKQSRKIELITHNYWVKISNLLPEILPRNHAFNFEPVIVILIRDVQSLKMQKIIKHKKELLFKKMRWERSWVKKMDWKKNLKDTDNSIVNTRGKGVKGGKREKVNIRGINGDGRRLDLGDEHKI